MKQDKDILIQPNPSDFEDGISMDEYSKQQEKAKRKGLKVRSKFIIGKYKNQIRALTMLLKRMNKDGASCTMMKDQVVTKEEIENGLEECKAAVKSWKKFIADGCDLSKVPDRSGGKNG